MKTEADFYNRPSELGGFTLSFEGIWKLEDNQEGVKKIVEDLFHNQRFGEIRYFSYGNWSKWKKIRNFDYGEHVNNKNGTTFYGFNDEEKIYFRFTLFRLGEKFSGESLYNCQKNLDMHFYCNGYDFRKIKEYTYFLGENYPFHFAFMIDARGNTRDFIKQNPGFFDRYKTGNYMAFLLGDFLYPSPFFTDETLATLPVHKIEKLENGGVYIQVNKKDPLSLESEENKNNYIKYLKAMNNIAPDGTQKGIMASKKLLSLGALYGLQRIYRMTTSNHVGKEAKSFIKSYFPEVLNDKGELVITPEEAKKINNAMSFIGTVMKDGVAYKVDEAKPGEPGSELRVKSNEK